MGCLWRTSRFLLKVARDISDRVRAEEQREKLRQFEAELAHLDRLTMLGELTASEGAHTKNVMKTLDGFLPFISLFLPLFCSNVESWSFR